MPARALLLLALIAAGGCATRAPAPTPESAQATPPDLGGRTVMVLPAQFPAGGGTATALEPVPGLDAELAFWLGERGRRVTWVFPPAIDRALERNPTLGIRPRALAVGDFHSVEVRNIGDPLFGDLRRLGALLDARYALVPTSAARVARDGRERVEISAALIDTLGGNVLWFGVVAGETGAPGGALAASAAEALARAVLW